MTDYEYDPEKLYVVKGRTLLYLLKLWERLYDTRHLLSDDERRDLANTLSGFLTSDVGDLEKLIDEQVAQLRKEKP